MRRWLLSAVNLWSLRRDVMALVGFWGMVAILSLEHVCYTYVWKAPAKFRESVVKVCGSPRHKGLIEGGMCVDKFNGTPTKDFKVFRKLRTYGERSVPPSAALGSPPRLAAR